MSPKKSKIKNKIKTVILPNKADKKFDIFFDLIKNITDKTVIKIMTYTVGACLDKKEKPSKTGVKNQ